ncbi:MAG: hypothetical protein COT91_03125 [Candidatus Doudnabacteria bacterium CG10_big_fil_rev_8_21_14_0_10_41_10]|uniref:Uncharacterized protein n=1 Tax=Candidatus Doudnabacteria bacterium CG10_big_fil_rev_8_21_14_0_10_41_10 TaxID=1974551 RepID=A0A2H0VFK6_9BACT|nr:MAG: hypothetical protein COT91_03125 [Candidatus Doudnabacteria bacterium CG10_big_fil_rev_8_21_14_0_10_41_10]
MRLQDTQSLIFRATDPFGETLVVRELFNGVKALTDACDAHTIVLPEEGRHADLRYRPTLPVTIELSEEAEYVFVARDRRIGVAEFPEGLRVDLHPYEDAAGVRVFLLPSQPVLYGQVAVPIRVCA